MPVFENREMQCQWAFQNIQLMQSHDLEEVFQHSAVNFWEKAYSF
jgi:hypothetical protein